ADPFALHVGRRIGDPHHPPPEADHEDRRHDHHEQREPELVPLVDEEVLPAPLVSAGAASRAGRCALHRHDPAFALIVGMIFLIVRSSTPASTQSRLACLTSEGSDDASTEAPPSRNPNRLFSGYVAISMWTLQDTTFSDPWSFADRSLSVPST